jgi:alkylation response protein AidB-like acyl-CoA dehydrogenase
VSAPTTITSPDDPALAVLCQRLAALAERPGADDRWPREQLDLLAAHGALEWPIAAEWGGQGWCEADLHRATLKIGGACLLTAFVLSQRGAAIRRIALSGNDFVCSQLLPPLCRGEALVTLGISQLTTSRRHLSQPVLRATPCAAGYTLDGYTPWVTGARHAQHVVVGAELPDGQQLLLILPTELAGVEIADDHPLLALAGSATAELRCRDVLIGREWLLAGPAANVVSRGLGARSGGSQTVTLALALAGRAIDHLEATAADRPPIAAAAARLRARYQLAEAALLRAAAGDGRPEGVQLRLSADALVQDATKAALIAAKGSGFFRDHPAGRWAQQALFFLVWSAPAAVLEGELQRITGP